MGCVEKYGTARKATDDNLRQPMRCACWINGLQTRSKYITLTAFPRQQFLRERASILV